MEITISEHARARADELARWSEDDVRAALRSARHMGAMRDGLEVWWSKGRYRKLILLVRAEGLVGCRPVRLAVITVMPFESTHREVCRARDGTGRKGWQAQAVIPDPWAVRSTSSPGRRGPSRAA